MVRDHRAQELPVPHPGLGPHADEAEREYERREGAEIVLDWRGLGGMPAEARISRLARWVDEAERRNLRYRLRLPGESLGPAQGPAHRHACLRAQALLPHAVD